MPDVIENTASFDTVVQALTAGNGVEFLDNLRKSSQQNYDAIARTFGNDVIEPPVALLELAYYILTSVWHARSVEIKAITATGSGWHVVAKDKKIAKDGEAKQVEDYLNLLAQNGTTHNDFSSLLAVLASDYESLGNFYAEVVRDYPGGPPVELYHVPAVTIKKRQQGGYYQLAYQGAASVFESITPAVGQMGSPASNSQQSRLFGGGSFARIIFRDFGTEPVGEENEIIQVKKYHSLSPFYGIPAWIAAVGAIMGDEAAEKWNLLFFRNNRIPRKLIQLLGMNPKDPNIEKLKEEVKQYFRNISQPHSMMVLTISNPDAKVQVDDLESAQNEGSFLKYKDMNRDEILAAHGVPPRMLGVISPGNLGGEGDAASQRKDFRDFTVAPLQQVLTQWINQMILPAAGYENYEVKLKSFDMSDSKDFATTSTAARENVRNGMMSFNEAREKIGLSRIEEDWANKHYVFFGDRIMPLNDQTAEQSGEDQAVEQNLASKLRQAQRTIGKA